MKKLLSLLLSFTLVISCFSFTASAAAKSMKEKNGVFTIEAEKASINNNYTEESDKNASGGAYLVTKLDAQDKPDIKSKGNIEFSFTPKVSGKHYLWVYVNPSTESKSCWLSIGAEEFKAVRFGKAANVWSWAKIAEFDASEGKSTLIKFNTNIGYFSVDKFEISSSDSYLPEGAELPSATATAASAASTDSNETTNPIEAGTKSADMKKSKKVYFIEAEDAVINSIDASVASDSSASGANKVTITKNHQKIDGETNGVLEFDFTAPEKGTYSLWTRANPNSSSKSLWYALDDEEFTSVRIGGNKGEWIWVGIARFEAEAKQKIKIKIIQNSGWFSLDCFVMGQDSGSEYIPSDEDFSLSGSAIGSKPAKKLKSKGNYKTEPVSIDKMKNAVALLVDNSNAYAAGSLTKVDKDNNAVVPVIINDRTLVPIRFIAESFGADVGWDESTSTASVKLGEKNISITLGKAEMIVDGSSIALDVAADTINDRTMLPLRAVSESLDKNVFWDERGLIVITDSNVNMDKDADSEPINAMLGYLKSGELHTTYAAVPHFTQSVIDKAVTIKKFTFSKTNSHSNDPAEALYYLTLAAGVNENMCASNGTKVKDAALVLLRHLIAGGNEPICSHSCWWSHAVVSAALLLVKNTPAIYNELTEDEKDRVEFLELCLAIGGNWGFNDENNYSTGLDMKGNAGKTWNPNHRQAYLPTVIMASLYFGADELDEMFVNFDYDEYMKKLEEYGFVNIIDAWSNAGKELMENGGEAILIGQQGVNGQKAGDSAGTGKGVKIPFKYLGYSLKEIDKMYENLTEYTYKGIVANELEDKAYILSGKSSPYLGYNGQMTEFNASDGNGVRSAIHYCIDSFIIVMPVLANLKMLGLWNSESDEQRDCDERMYVGNNDLIFKAQEGYVSYSLGRDYGTEYESTGGFAYAAAKDLWINFHCMKNEDITIVSAPEDKPAEPYMGITEPGEGAYVSKESKGDTFDPESYYNFDKEYKGEVCAEFDLVFGNDIDSSFNGVVMFDKQNAQDLIWSTANVLIQCSGKNINIRNGTKYDASGLKFAANYRYHFRVIMNASKKTYSVYMTPIWPEKGEEKLVAENVAFRTGANEIDNIGSLIMATEVGVNGIFWVENLKITE